MFGNKFKTKIIMKKISILFLIFLIFYSCSEEKNVFLHTEGQKIVNSSGENVLLRGLGLGGWMVQEGYMLKTSGFAGPQHVIKQKIGELIGEKKTEKFYDAYLTNGITKKDIDSLAAWGFNSVRLPMHYNLYINPSKNNQKITWNEKGFQMTDDLLKWCSENNVYLILDLHAAPGGQGNDANISDYDNSKPSLWESDFNKKKMISLWKKLAERYKNEPWIGGYDIINEPNWNFTGENKNGCDETSNAPLRELMVEVTKAIREVDKNHIIMVEGNCWGNNYKGIFPLWDDNTVISFHKYWNHNTQESIQQMIDYSKEQNAPIWLGESGENSNVWFKDAISLVESNNIGWAFWPMKKVENIAGVTSVKMNDGFDKLLKYWNDGGEKPSEEFAEKALMELAENYKIENVTTKPDVIDAMFRQVQTNETKPYVVHNIPGIIFATEYDLGSQGYAYSDKDFVNYRVDTGKFETWNSGNTMRNDGVDIQYCKDKITNNYEVFDINDNEWLLFTVNSDFEGDYSVVIRYLANDKQGNLHLEVNAVKSKNINLPITNNTYNSVKIEEIKLKKGTNKIKVVFNKGDFIFNYFEVVKNKE